MDPKVRRLSGVMGRESAAYLVAVFCSTFRDPAQGGVRRGKCRVPELVLSPLIPGSHAVHLDGEVMAQLLNRTPLSMTHPWT